ncbi:hypothetical protein EPI10_024559 [Gossypium australe]|uniref:Uncharacterized protein n=1 Tax=Gossypium australe TaxID=47621 RepID=A0A5B6VZA8_9ROSI|nr:hypothetical protein EPI10_024559 [Gossypium australe]
MNGKTFIQERGFNPSSTECDAIWELVGFHHWRAFCSAPNELTVDERIERQLVLLQPLKRWVVASYYCVLEVSWLH